MPYIPPFEVIKKGLRFTPRADGLHIDMQYDELVAVIKLLLRSVPVDERWYRGRYEDVDLAISSGEFTSAKHHFIENGYFEGRTPFELDIDEDWYLTTNPDVVEGLHAGNFKSARDHFVDCGYREGRLPSKW